MSRAIAVQALLFATSLFLASADAQKTPEGYRWVNLQNEGDVMARVNHALASERLGRIRKIGVIGDSALVFAADRDDENSWTVYDVALRTSHARKLLGGFQLKIFGWCPFVPRAPADLAVTFLDCDECEPATMFTAFHYDRNAGWQVRWPASRKDQTPGVLLLLTDVGDPYTDETVDQVWAPVATSPGGGPVSIGTWYHARDKKTGKVTSVAMKFWIDPVSHEEKSVALEGSKAMIWEQTICRATNVELPGFAHGQRSQSCKAVLAQKLQVAKP